MYFYPVVIEHFNYPFGNETIPSVDESPCIRISEYIIQIFSGDVLADISPFLTEFKYPERLEVN